MTTNKNIKFSIIIPVYNKEKYVKKTIESVLNQSYTNYEIIIIDDGSNDSSAKILSSIESKKLQLISKENTGVSDSRNIGIDLSTGDIICFLDADDCWDVEHLTKLHETISSHDTEALWGCGAFRVNRNGSLRSSNCFSSYSNNAISDLISGLTIWTGTVFVSRMILLKNKELRFNIDYNHGEDREFWYSLSLLYPNYIYNKNSTAIYNLVENSLTDKNKGSDDLRFLTFKKRLEFYIENYDADNRFASYLDKQSQVSFLNRMAISKIPKILIRNLMTEEPTLFPKYKLYALDLLKYFPQKMRRIFIRLYFLLC